MDSSEEALLRGQRPSAFKLCLKRTCTTMNTVRLFWIFGFLLCSICIGLFTVGPHAITARGDSMGFWEVRICTGSGNEKNCTISSWVKPSGCHKFGTPAGICCVISTLTFLLPVLLLMEAIHRERKRIPQRKKVNLITMLLSSAALLLCHVPSIVWIFECMLDWPDSLGDVSMKYTGYWSLWLVPVPFILLYVGIELIRMYLKDYAILPVSV